MGPESQETAVLTVLPALVFLLGIEIALGVAHLLVHMGPSTLGRFGVWFDLGREGTIPSWFSASQLLIAGLMPCFAGWRGWGADPQALLFAVAGLGFVFLSADESARIHERITAATVNYEWTPHFPGSHGVWIFVYGLIGLALCLLFRRSLFAVWRERREVALMIGAGFSTIVAGGVVVEILWYYELMTGPLQTLLEEFLEMFGGSLIVCGGLLLVRPMVRLAPLS